MFSEIPRGVKDEGLLPKPENSPPMNVKEYLDKGHSQGKLDKSTLFVAFTQRPVAWHEFYGGNHHSPEQRLDEIGRNLRV